MWDVSMRVLGYMTQASVNSSTTVFSCFQTSAHESSRMPLTLPARPTPPAPHPVPTCCR